jgi:hypothetical protein
MEDKNQKQDEGKAEVTKETKEEVKAEAKDKNAPAAEPIKYTAVEPRPPRKLTELKVTFGPLTEKNRELLRAINKLCLPVSYSNDFYLSLALTPGRYCRFGKPHPQPYS